MLGVVSKPQFDTDVFKVGKAIHVTKFAESNGYKLVDNDAIIVESNPLELSVIYVRNDKYGIALETKILIKIEEVIKETVEITELKEEK